MTPTSATIHNVVQCTALGSSSKNTLCTTKIPHSNVYHKKTQLIVLTLSDSVHCTIRNVLLTSLPTAEKAGVEGGHPVEWRDIKTAGEVLPNPLSGQTTHKNWSKKCNRNSSTVNVKPTPFYPTSEIG